MPILKFPGTLVDGFANPSNSMIDPPVSAITGTGFGVKTTSETIEDFSGLTEGAIAGDPISGSIGTLVASVADGLSIVSDEFYSGTKSLHNGFNVNHFPRVHKILSGNSPSAYMAGYFKFTGNGGTVWKHARIGDGSVYSGNPKAGSSYTSTLGSTYPDLSFGGELTNNSGSILGYEANSNGAFKNQLDEAYLPDTWLFYEFEFYAGTEGGSDCYVSERISGKETLLWENLSYLETGDNSLPTWLVSMMNGNDGTTSLEMWIDSLYIDESRSRLVITDAPIYADSTKWAVQEIESWTDTEISPKASQKVQGFYTGEVAYYHVFNNGSLVHSSDSFTVENGDLGVPELIAAFDFKDGVEPAYGAVSGSQAGGSIDYSNNTLRMTYPEDLTGGDIYNYFAVGTFDETEIYVEFDARYPSTYKAAAKFFKIFGQTSGSSTSNVTIQPVWGTGTIEGIFFGDGTNVQNDAQNVIRLDGTYPEWCGRSYSQGAVINTPQNASFTFDDEEFHHFKIRVKFNSGTTAENEINDGEFYLEIDGNVYVDAKNIFNRHYSNLPMSGFNLGDWSQAATDEFVLEYDNVVVSKKGFIPKVGVPELTSPDFHLVANLSGAKDTSVFDKDAYTVWGADDPTEVGNKVLEARYSPDGLQGDLSNFSEQEIALPIDAVQVVVKFREYTPATYSSVDTANHKSVGFWSGAYGKTSANISISSECWPRSGDGYPSMYAGNDGTNFGHFRYPFAVETPLWIEAEGAWHDVTVVIELAKEEGAFGRYRFYRNEELIVDSDDQRMFVDYNANLRARAAMAYATRGNFIDTIRLFGWANKNSGSAQTFVDPMVFLYDDIEVQANATFKPIKEVV